jgi:hypothetical protein
MDPLPCSRRQILDEDLQIVRVTLATIVSDVRTFSEQAADTIEEAIARLDRAQREFSGLCDTCAAETHLRPRGRQAQCQVQQVEVGR